MPPSRMRAPSWARAGGMQSPHMLYPSHPVPLHMPRPWQAGHWHAAAMKTQHLQVAAALDETQRCWYETRAAPDGHMYTQHEFIDHYRGLTEWNSAGEAMAEVVGGAQGMIGGARGRSTGYDRVNSTGYDRGGKRKTRRVESILFCMLKVLRRLHGPRWHH